jgi:hypothetical protein
MIFSREQFEQCMRDWGEIPDDQYLCRQSDGAGAQLDGYVESDIDLAWRTWQCVSVMAEAARAPLIEQLRVARKDAERYREFQRFDLVAIYTDYMDRFLMGVEFPEHLNARVDATLDQLKGQPK